VSTKRERLITDVLDEAIGKGHRLDPVVASTGGPAGNARMTAWVGLLLLALLAVELITLIDVGGLISWHIVVGTLLVPVALLKTATTTWRAGGYYTGNRFYKSAGPPPMLLRILGPLVVVSTLGVLGSGLALVALGPGASRTALFTALGQRVDTVTLHQALFVLFAVATGLHILARVVPAVTLATGRLMGAGSARSVVPGGGRRMTLLLATLVISAIAAFVVLDASVGWEHDGAHHLGPHPASDRGVTGSR
jgi:hypothetical protein